MSKSKKSKKSILIVALLLTSAFALSSCSSATTTTPSESPSAIPSLEADITASPSSTTEPTIKPAEEEIIGSTIDPSVEPTKEESTVSSEEGSTLQQLRTKAVKENAYCAVSYIGYTENNDAQDMKENLTGSYKSTEFAFVDEIPVSNVVSAVGCDVYCIVPANSDSTITVYSQSFDDDANPVKGDIIYQGGSDPILLNCNVSDIMTNSIVAIDTPEKHYEFSPYISLQDGTVAFDTKDQNIYVFQKDAEQ